MSDNIIKKIIIVILYLSIIILVPLFIDYLFKLTVRKKREDNIRYLAQQKSSQTNKSLIVFINRHYGIVINVNDPKSAEEFSGDIIEIVHQMANDSCVLVLMQVLEYIDDTIENPLSIFIEKLMDISGGDLYTVNIEKNSPRVFWDYKIINIMDTSFYLPEDFQNGKIKWNKTNDLQKHTQKIYSHLFKIIPYKFFIN